MGRWRPFVTTTTDEDLPGLRGGGAAEGRRRSQEGEGKGAGGRRLLGRKGWLEAGLPQVRGASPEADAPEEEEGAEGVGVQVPGVPLCGEGQQARDSPVMSSREKWWLPEASGARVK